MENANMIGVWDFQMGEVPAGAREWWTANIPLWKRGEYAYRIEFWKGTGHDGVMKCAVVYEYAKHPVSGQRYIERRESKRSCAAVNRPRVIDLDKFPPKKLR